MAVIYSDYSRDKIGWFFGLNGWQLASLAATSLPFFWSIQQTAWRSALLFLALWAAIALLTVTSVRGRSATGWLLATLAHTIGGLTGWTRFTAHAATGRANAGVCVDIWHHTRAAGGVPLAGSVPAAAVRCVQLDDEDRCRLFGDPRRPAVCASLAPSEEMCGDRREVAMAFLDRLERLTAADSTSCR